MDFLPSEVSRKSVVLACTTIAVGLVVLSTVTLTLFLAGLRSEQHDRLLDEIQEMRTQAARTARRIEHILESQGLTDLGDLADAGLLDAVDEWGGGDPARHAYAAVVDAQGILQWHTDARQRGKQLKRDWYESMVPDLGVDVVRTQDETLAAGRLVYDLRAPITRDGRYAGSYHIGLSLEGFAERWMRERSHFLSRHAPWIAIIILVIAAAVWSLYFLTVRLLSLQEMVTQTYMRAAEELGRLAAGLAHEIRNPLHALRLNLHAFRRVQQDAQALEPAEVTRMLEQSVEEIDRIDRLLGQLSHFTTPDEPRAEAFNLNAELEGIVDFISQELRRSNVEVQLDLPKSPASVHMDRAQLRQIMLNLLHNARDSMPDGGRIDVRLVRKTTQVEILVADQGRGISAADRPHVFEPFYSTSDDGTGLGLALVKRFVEDAGGQIQCHANTPQGTQFLIRLRAA
ncbi:MAG: sensor histidine kinase [Planctomycetaceae bacterium]|nr:MAG: sensor histidine kinase [Planctomycetaceae bacterium]